MAKKKRQTVHRMKQVVCSVEERHDITHEPYRLRVLPPETEVNLEEESDFVIMLGSAKTFERLGGGRIIRVEQ